MMKHCRLCDKITDHLYCSRECEKKDIPIKHMTIERREDGYVIRKINYHDREVYKYRVGRKELEDQLPLHLNTLDLED